MIFRSLVVALLLLIKAGVSPAQVHHLTFVKKIGVGWQLDKWGWMSRVQFSRDGTMVASDGATSPTDVSNEISLWTFPEGRLVKRLPYAVWALSPNWKYAASKQGVVDVETGKVVLPTKPQAELVEAFSPDGRYVVESRLTKRKGFKIVVFEISTGKQVSAFGRRQAFSLAVSPDGTTLAAGYWNVVTLWNMLTGERLSILEGLGRYVEAISFSKDGKLLAVGTDFGKVQVWDVENRTQLHSIDIEGSYPAPAFNPDGKLLAVGTYGTGTVWLIDVASGKIIDHQKVSDMGCGSVAFSPDGQYLITPSTGGLIKWPYDRGGTIRVFKVNAP